MKTRKAFDAVISVILTFVLLIVSISADEMNPITGDTLGRHEVSVIFGENCSLTSEQRTLIVNLLVNHTEMSGNRNLWCSLFGHKTTIETVTVIKHKVSDTQPRCWKEIYEVTICSRCDYAEEAYICGNFIYCCSDD